MQNPLSSEGIVLRSQDYKEREKIITVFTAQAGLVSLIVKGISQRNHRFLSLTTPFCQAEFIFIKRSSDLFRFYDGTLLDGHFPLRAQLKHLQAAGLLANTILHSQLPGKPAPLLYALFSSYLKQIPFFADPNPLIASFYLKTLHHEGLFSPLSPFPSFSPSEWSLLQELTSSRSFNEIKKLNIHSDLINKIQLLFKRQI